MTKKPIATEDPLAQWRAQGTTPPDHIIRAAGGKVPVTMRALIARINRKLAPEGKRLKIVRGWKARSDLGDYYILNPNRNWIVGHHVDPEGLGRKLGVLEGWEQVASEAE
jgi:hypothetical protein